MKKLSKIIVSVLCAASLAVPVLATACNTSDEGDNPGGKHVDYVSQCKLDLDSETKKQEVTVRLYVDGDTTHFDPVPNSSLKGCSNAADFSRDGAPTKGYAKARYLAVNTPESTGQIEPFGKAASNFTRSKLEKATSVIIESDDNKWNIDSTGTRYLLWIWYMPEGSNEYRNLNIDILQAGLAYNSSANENRYAEYCMKALGQAEAEKLYVFSGEKDPDYYYGGPINIDLKELRFNTEAYAGKRIIVEGTVVANFNNSAYIEKTFYDVEGYAEEGIRIGMPVYYSFTTGKVLDILSVGNEVSVSGVVQFYETGGYYQITDIKTYDRWDEKNPNNCNLLNKVGLDNAYTLIDPAEFVAKDESVSVEINKIVDGETVPTNVSMSYQSALLGTSVSLENLTVVDVYTTHKEDSASKGAMTLTCRAPDNTEITVRTEVLYGEYNELMIANDYDGQTIDVKGVVEYFDGGYQIKCHRTDYITVHRDDAGTAQAAINIVKKLYNAAETVATDSDFNVYGKIKVDGVFHDVTWTAGANVSDYVQVGTVLDKELLTVSVTRPNAEIEYTLTASVTVNGETVTCDFTRTVADVDTRTAQAAIKAVKEYDAAQTVTPGEDFTVCGKVEVDGTLCDVNWTVSQNASEYVQIGTALDKELLTVSVTKPAQAIEYTLTATVTVNGKTATYTFTKTLPKA